MTFLELKKKLENFWCSKLNITQFLPLDVKVGAGTFHPLCFFSSFDNISQNILGIQKSTRKADGMWGESPNRLVSHHQLQLLIHNPSEDIVKLYKESLEYIGLKDFDIVFNENNWKNITLGAIGTGSEILCNNMEITQFTYFQKMGDVSLKSNSIEITYGLERILCAFLQKNIFDCHWDQNTLYKTHRFEEEKQFSDYYFNFNLDSPEDFAKHIKQSDLLIENNLYLPAYERILQAIDIFNSLDAKKTISLIERKNYIDIIRSGVNKIAKKYLELKC